MISLYREKTSWLHRQSAGSKLFALCLLSVLVFPISQLFLLTLLGVFTASFYFSLGQGGLREIKTVWLLWPWFLVMWLFHAFAGDPVLGVVVVLKMLLMILLANLLTLTTRQTDLLAALEFMFRPLTWIGLSTRPLALAVSMMVRYIPVLLALLQQHQQAWQARGGAQRGRWKLVVPALIGALKLAENAGESLLARGGVRGLR